MKLTDNLRSEVALLIATSEVVRDCVTDISTKFGSSTTVDDLEWRECALVSGVVVWCARRYAGEGVEREGALMEVALPLVRAFAQERKGGKLKNDLWLRLHVEAACNHVRKTLELI